MGPHNKKSPELLLKYGDIKALYGAVTDKSEKSLSKSEQKRASEFTLKKAQKVMDYCAKNSVDIITLFDKRYPARLSGIYNPPILLFCYGDISCLEDSLSITVVGARNPSQYSVDVASRICRSLSELGVVIVSGFALGIDSVAHGSALKSGGKTVAVLACGIDVKYPSANSKVKHVIAKGNGAVITEYLPGTRTRGEFFQNRNRILSGLSNGTLVIEASAESGSLITAEHAVEQGRELFCIPPANLFDSRYSGVIKYIRDGAIPTFSHMDIVYEYYDYFTDKIAEDDRTYGLEDTKAEDIRINKPTEPKPAKEENTANEKAVDTDGLGELQKKIIEILSEKQANADELSYLTGEDISNILAELTELEIFGYIKLTAGQRYTIN